MLIISYFFPPGNFPGSYRVEAWANYFHEFGFYPIVITRHWSGFENNFTEESIEKTVTREVHKNYSIIRLPFRGSSREKITNKIGEKFAFLSKPFSFFELTLQNYFSNIGPFSDFYYLAKEELKRNDDVEVVISTGRPFVLFQYCSKLKEEFPNIKWVADYRDPWNTNESINDSYRRRLQKIFEKNLEKKWTRNASLITTVSVNLAIKISDFIEKPVKVVFNGFEGGGGNAEVATKKNNEFSMVYIGSLYPRQIIEPFLNAYKEATLEYKNLVRIRLSFVGTRPTRLLKSFINKNTEVEIELLPRVARNQSLKIQKNADLLLMFGHKGRKGVLSSKVFEYMATGRPVFLYGSEDEELTNLIKDTGIGIVANGPIDNRAKLFFVIEEFLQKGKISITRNENAINLYSRRNQTFLFAKMIEKIANNK